MVQINELEVGDIFYSANKFTLTFRDGSYQYSGVIRHGGCIVKKYKAVGDRKFQTISTLPFGVDEVEKIIESSHFDREIMIAMTEADLLRAWYINARETINAFENYHDGGRELTKWILESKKIEKAMEKNPEKWL